LVQWLHELGLFNFLGMIGVILYIGSYFSLQAGIIKGQGYLYASLIASAATCVLLSLAHNFNLSSAVIQITYILISIFGLIRFYISSNRISFSKEEKTFLEIVAPGLAAIDARKLLDLGMWNTAVPGTMLTEEGKQPERLYFVLDGAAKVEVAKAQVGELGPGSLVGEMSCLTGMKASASVYLIERSRLFSIGEEKLRRHLERNVSARQELQVRFGMQISEKLIRTNASLSAKQ
jgi:hypothetical protein